MKLLLSLFIACFVVANTMSYPPKITIKTVKTKSKNKIKRVVPPFSP